MFYIIDAVLGAACVGTAGTVGDCDAVNNEVCNADPVCECNAATGYEVSSGDATVCALKGKVLYNCFCTCFVVTLLFEKGGLKCIRKHVFCYKMCF